MRFWFFNRQDRLLAGCSTHMLDHADRGDALHSVPLLLQKRGCPVVHDDIAGPRNRPGARTSRLQFRRAALGTARQPLVSRGSALAPRRSRRRTASLTGWIALRTIRTGTDFHAPQPIRPDRCSVGIGQPDGSLQRRLPATHPPTAFQPTADPDGSPRAASPSLPIRLLRGHPDARAAMRFAGGDLCRQEIILTGCGQRPVSCLFRPTGCTANSSGPRATGGRKACGSRRSMSSKTRSS